MLSWAHIGLFCPFFSMCDQKPMWTRYEGGFSVIWVTKLLISPVKKRIFCPKTTKFGPKLAFLVNYVPCWWVGWWLWRAGCISQDTYLLYKLEIGGLTCLSRVWAQCREDHTQDTLGRETFLIKQSQTFRAKAAEEESRTWIEWKPCVLVWPRWRCWRFSLSVSVKDTGIEKWS